MPPPQIPTDQTGVIIVDHGSRRRESNEMLLEVVDAFRESNDFLAIEPAHMELAEPSLKTAFGRLVQQGAKLIVIHPYFLLPGRHWDEDIPALAAEAAAEHSDILYRITEPLGAHPLLGKILLQRIEECLGRTP